MSQDELDKQDARNVGDAWIAFTSVLIGCVTLVLVAYVTVLTIMRMQ